MDGSYWYYWYLRETHQASQWAFHGNHGAFCFSKAWSQICVELQTYRLNGYGELGKHNMLYMLKFIKKSKGMGEKDVI